MVRRWVHRFNHSGLQGLEAPMEAHRSTHRPQRHRVQ
ncbi:hypothetical protein NQU54_42590 [Streptomyces samsunensis]|uniref:Transposase n=1 Tax=Streptomyces malaysiensis subsp. samsunensis TaxID=459658 RepID=A0A9X2M4K3_STRMQ|nr:hypothetical protein [Streptomyces samsunensis]MCQ8835531.1 hypothetical protein [Streptomyces samsunensis]